MKLTSLALLFTSVLGVIAVSEPEGRDLLDEVAALQPEKSSLDHFDTPEEFFAFEQLHPRSAEAEAEAGAEPVGDAAMFDPDEDTSPNELWGGAGLLQKRQGCRPPLKTCTYKPYYCCARKWNACCPGQKWCINGNRAHCCNYRRAGVRACRNGHECCYRSCCKRGYSCCQNSSGYIFCSRGGCKSYQSNALKLSAADMKE